MEKREHGDKYTVRFPPETEKKMGKKRSAEPVCPIIERRVVDRSYFQSNEHLSNKISYCMETKVLTVTLAVAHFDETCHHKAGKEPPKPAKPDQDYDPVRREWVDRASTDVWTQERLYATYDL